MAIDANAGASGGTDNTDTSLNGEYRAGAGIYVNAQGEWTSPDGTVLRGQALAKAEANATAKYGIGYRTGNLYLEAVAEAKLRCEAAIKAEMKHGNHVAGAKAGAGARTYYTNDGLIPFAVNNDTSVSAGAQVGAKIGGGYQVPDWNKDSKPITFGGEVNIALIAGVKTGGTVTVDVDPVYDMTVEPVMGLVDDTVDVVNDAVDTVVAPVKDAVDTVTKPIQNVTKPIETIITNPPKIKPPKIKKPKWL
jgi:hypothetical protein